MIIDTHEDIKLSNAQIAWRAAQDIQDGAYVNLGIGFPEMVARYQPEGREAIFHTENGILDFGEAPPEGEEDWDLINAGKKAVTLKPGAAFFIMPTALQWFVVGIWMLRFSEPTKLPRTAISQTGGWAPKVCQRSAARWTLFMARNRSLS